MPAAGAPSAAQTAGKPAKVRRESIRMWAGCRLKTLFPLLCRHGFRVSPSRWHSVVGHLISSGGNALAAMAQQAIYGRKVEGVTLEEDPVFVLGHWRTGTTLLHELLVLDPRHNYPTLYQCMQPTHFLLTERLLRRLTRFLVPQARPMDNMPLRWEGPQEDEFALCLLGVPSPYVTIGFPNDGPAYDEYLYLENLSPQDLARWQAAFLRFLKQLTLRDPRRLVLKSPTHTCRLRVLNEMFPRARFVYIVRDPLAVFPSTVHLWKTLYRTHGLQVPTYQGLEEYVLATFARMHESLEAARPVVAPDRFCQVRYEDLVADGIGQMRRIYEHLGLGDFSAVQPRHEDFWQQATDYQTNRYQVTDAQRQEISRRWRPYLEQHGYPDPAAPAA